MNESEAWAKDHLPSRGFKAPDIEFEPDSIVPPDFLVECRIAVEVRRLNQHWQSSTGDIEHIEKLAAPLQDRLKKLLLSFSPPSNGVTWDVFCDFDRPQLTKKWEPILRRELQPFQDGHFHAKERTIQIDTNFKLQLVQRQSPATQAFSWREDDDLNTGGWPRFELEKSLAFCIREKSVKVAKYRTKYPEWWLILIDHMLGGAAIDVHIEHKWDRVLIIDPNNLARACEIRNTKK